MKPIRAVFAPDWRDGVPYQRLLAEALSALGIEVGFLRDYRRGLPLSRLLAPWQRAGRCDLLHLHWPEAYYQRKRDGLDWLRGVRFPLDLALATRRSRLVVTAHNLQPHDRANEYFTIRNSHWTYRRADHLFAHSSAAAEALVQTCGVVRERISVIPHGDLSVAMPPPPPRAEARRRLGFGEEKVCLIFGVAAPYKGIEEVLEYWRDARPDAFLVIAGNPKTPEYGATLRQAAEGLARVRLQLDRLSDEGLATWLTAADCALFNYRTIFTSGAASLARSWGLPILLPTRLTTVDLDEPSPRVQRFAGFGTDFARALAAALDRSPDFAAAASWRAACSWEKVASVTAAGYRRALAAGAHRPRPYSCESK